MTDEYKSTIPVTAVEQIVEYYPTGQKRRVEYLVDGAVVGSRIFEETGELQIEIPLKDGVKHGVEYRWHKTGHLKSAEPYVEGLVHGTAKQFSFDGKLIGTYTMEHGTGIDLWRHEENDIVILDEVFYMKDGKLHGFEWWLNYDQVSVWHERHWDKFQVHGIERMWNAKDRLRRGYPRYFVHDERVSKAKYIRACASDPSLPPFRVQDNDPQREFPPEIRVHLGFR